MASEIMKLSQHDVIRSLISAVFVAIVAVLYGLTQQPDFNVFSANWGEVFKIVINASFLTFFGRLGEKFVTDKNAKIFGRIG